jgi:uncharacterized membrane protein HdeD (DUF308 family)
MTPQSHLLLGALAMATTMVGLIFLRLWQDSRDRFFLFFALSFFAQAVNRIALALSADPQEGHPLHYLVRLAAYILIILAILDKNRPAREARSVPPRSGTI